MKTLKELVNQYPEATIENAIRIFVRYFSQPDLDHSKNHFTEDEYVDPRNYFKGSPDPERDNNYIAMQIIDRIHWYLAKKNNLGIIKTIPPMYEKIIEFNENELCKMLGFSKEEYDGFIHFQLTKVPCGVSRYDVCGFEDDLV
ncbi:hypothetical protein [Anabaena sp. UHCC 0451]|uniref:hypothetical protein n=1 Tax=Anabaena sp. UHCC 0451 TaxID=2055235 RepID=UPI002B2153B0|nr:hypothetical protein [Anabaena sp. UHCC 0451]MEA5577599.1 hypothetical protein [Anabaena sp. UHCC 0451]